MSRVKCNNCGKFLPGFKKPKRQPWEEQTPPEIVAEADVDDVLKRRGEDPCQAEPEERWFVVVKRFFEPHWTEPLMQVSVRATVYVSLNIKCPYCGETILSGGESKEVEVDLDEVNLTYLA